MGGCGERCRHEFRLKRFLLQHEQPQTFVQFQFGYQRLYLIWRLFWAVYHVAWIIVTGVRSHEWGGEDSSQYVKWFIFLTDWAYFSLTVSTLVDAATVLFVFIKRPDIRDGTVDKLPWYMKASWCIFNIGNVISVATSVTYWALVYDGSQAMTAVNIETHVLNAVYVLLNISVTGVPKQILHFWFSALFGVIYALFTLFYYLAGGTNHNENPYVYPVIDWRKPGTSVLYSVIVVFVLVPLVHLLLFGLHNLKVLIHEKSECCRGDSDGPMVSTVEMKQQFPY